MEMSITCIHKKTLGEMFWDSGFVLNFFLKLYTYCFLYFDSVIPIIGPVGIFGKWALQ